MITHEMKVTYATEMSLEGQSGDIMSQWHRGFHHDLAEDLGSKTDPEGFGRRMYQLEETLIKEGYLEKEWDFSDESNPVLIWKLGSKALA
jgi:hypothetical protein